MKEAFSRNLFLLAEGGSEFLRNVDMYLPNYLPTSL